MTIFKTIQEYKRYVGASTQLSIESLEPYLKSAQRDHLKPALGLTLFTDLLNSYEASTLSTELENLLPYAQAVVANIGYESYIEGIGTLHVGDAGVASSVGENQKTPFKWQVDQTKSYHRREGMKALDDLLEFLETNRADYPDWENSAAYTLHKATLLYTTNQVNEVFEIGNSRIVFNLLRPTIKEMEQTTIVDLLGQTLYDALLTKLQNNTAYSAVEEKVVELCRRSTVWLALLGALPKALVKLNELGVTQPSLESQLDSGDANKPAPAWHIRAMQETARKSAGESLTRLHALLTANASALSWTDPTGSNIDVNENIEGGAFML